jgi:hypothetical protein
VTSYISARAAGAASAADSNRAGIIHKYVRMFKKPPKGTQRMRSKGGRSKFQSLRARCSSSLFGDESPFYSIRMQADSSAAPGRNSDSCGV